jgi:3-methylcrotonyl-CoA carboxylase alpha subunit
MIAKVIMRGTDRDAAIKGLCKLIDGIEVWPVRANGSFIYECLDDPDFAAAKLTTSFIEERIDTLVLDPIADEAIWETATDFALEYPKADETTPIGFRLNAEPRRSVTLTHLGETKTISPSVGLGDATGYTDEEKVLVFLHGAAFQFDRSTRGSGTASAADGAILAPMPGKVIAVDVSEGDAVSAGQRLMVLEAMKMEHALTAPFDGTVTGLEASEGGQVQVEAVLCVVEPPNAA